MRIMQGFSRTESRDSMARIACTIAASSVSCVVRTTATPPTGRTTEADKMEDRAKAIRVKRAKENK